ncbi:hypothetical protein K440DRAFT_637941 [Wilcoxina mikolae CBS 423.85]|nr:hypothetical protein K440DRAFT_637941 [Wilcoxina mikolae CBS 423.85]
MSSRPGDPFPTVISYNFGNTYVYAGGTQSAGQNPHPRGSNISSPGYVPTMQPAIYQGFYTPGYNGQAISLNIQPQFATPLIYRPTYEDYQRSVRLATGPPILHQTINHNYYIGDGYYRYGNNSGFHQQEIDQRNFQQEVLRERTVRFASDAESQHNCSRCNCRDCVKERASFASDAEIHHNCRRCNCKDCVEERASKEACREIFRGMTDSEKRALFAGQDGKREEKRSESAVQQNVDATQEMNNIHKHRETPVEDSTPRPVHRQVSGSSIASSISSIPSEHTPVGDGNPRTVKHQSSTSSISSSTVTIPRQYTPASDYDFFCALPPRPTYVQPSYGFSAYRQQASQFHSFPDQVHTPYIPTPYPAYGPWDPHQPTQYQSPMVETISSSSIPSPAKDERHNVRVSEEKKVSVPGSWPESPKNPECRLNSKTSVGNPESWNAPPSNDAWNKKSSGNLMKDPCGRKSPDSSSPQARNDPPKTPVQSPPTWMEYSKPSAPLWGECSSKDSDQGWDNGTAQPLNSSKPTASRWASDSPKASDKRCSDSPTKPTASGWATNSPKASVQAWDDNPVEPTATGWATDSPKDAPVEPTVPEWITNSVQGSGNSSTKPSASEWVADSAPGWVTEPSAQGWGSSSIKPSATEDVTRSPGASGDWWGNTSVKSPTPERVIDSPKASVQGWGGSASIASPTTNWNNIKSPPRRHDAGASYETSQSSPLKWETKTSWNDTSDYPLKVTVHQEVKEEGGDSEKGEYSWGSENAAEDVKGSWGSPTARSGNGNWGRVSPPLRGAW